MQIDDKISSLTASLLIVYTVEGGYLLIHAYKPALESVPVTEVVHDIANIT